MKNPHEDESEALLVARLITANQKAEKEKLDHIKKILKVFMVNLWGTRMVCVGPSKSAVVDHLLERGYVEGVGRIDLAEHIWELPGGGYPLDRVTVACAERSPLEAPIKAPISKVGE